MMYEEKVDNLNREIKKSEESIILLEGQLKEVKDASERYEIFWELKELYEKTKDNYRSLEIWSDKKHTVKFYLNLIREIYYFEVCLSMLKDKHGAKKIDLRHFLNAAELEYFYFIIEDNPLPDIFFNSSFQIDGFFTDQRINLIFNNIINAQKNLNHLLEYYKDEEKHKKLFIYNELMGDLYIHLFCCIQQFNNENLFKKNSSSRKNLICAFYYYNLSIWHKIQLERLNPTTGFDGLHGWPSLGLFHDFYNEIGVSHIHDVREKKEKLSEKYTLSNKETVELNQELKRAIHEFQR